MLAYIEKGFTEVRLPEGTNRVMLDDAHLPDIEAAVCCRATAKQMSTMDLPKLRLIQLTSTGYDGVPLEALARKGVQVANAAEVYGIPIAETVLLGMLQIAKKYRANPQNRRIRFTRGYTTIGELAGKKVLILGAGNIGTEIAKRVSGFQTEVIGYDVDSTPRLGFANIISTRDALTQMLAVSDYVICALPDNEATRGMINAEFLRDTKPGAVFVNVGRRAVLNERDLYLALKSGILGGAVLDMFEWFPNPFTNRFRRIKNVIVLPGVAAISRESRIRLLQLIADNLQAVAVGQEPHHVVNRMYMQDGC